MEFFLSICPYTLTHYPTFSRSISIHYHDHFITSLKSNSTTPIFISYMTTESIHTKKTKGITQQTCMCRLHQDSFRKYMISLPRSPRRSREAFCTFQCTFLRDWHHKCINWCAYIQLVAVSLRVEHAELPLLPLPHRRILRAPSLPSCSFPSPTGWPPHYTRTIWEWEHRNHQANKGLSVALDCGRQHDPRCGNGMYW